MKNSDPANAREPRIARRDVLGLGFGVSLGLAPTLALADAYPSRPVRLVVPFPAGGSVDQVARLVQRQVQEQLGQAVVIDNRPGAGGTIGAGEVARSKPDGYTLLMVLDSHAAAHHIFKQVPYDPLKSFEYLTLMVAAPVMVITSKSSPANTLAEMIELGKRKEGGLTFASAGTGSPAHLSALALAKRAGVKATHVPYGGGGPMIIAVARGEVDYAVSGISNVAGQLKGGLIKGLAVGSKARTKLTGSMPTIAETFPGFESTFWVGLVAPADLPRNVAQKIRSAMQGALRTPELASRLASDGFDVVNSDSREFTDRFRSDSKSFGALISQEQIKVD